MQPAIADHALLANRQTAALVAHGVVDWLCVPRFDSPAVFARLLGDEDLSSWSIVPVDARERSRQYRDHSFILDTVWECPEGELVTTDFLAVDSGDELPRVDLVRTVTCRRGHARVEHELTMRFDYGQVVPWVQRVGDAAGEPVLQAIAGPDSLALHGPRLEAQGRSHRGSFELGEGQHLTWILSWHPAWTEPPLAIDPDRAQQDVLAQWNDWHEQVGTSGPYAEAINRSLDVLLAMTQHRTGGLVAAPTTSLPETPGGERNWDYRYTWLRDSALAIEVLARHGHLDVAQQWRAWLLRAIAGDPADLQIMYGVDGGRILTENTLDNLAGYRGASPVRIGNGAYSQYQADVVGEVMLALDALRQAGMRETRFSWALQRKLITLLVKRFDEPDQGIWEMRGEPHMFTHGRIMMWAAFDCGVRAIDAGLAGPRERWVQCRERLREEILEHGVRDGCLVQHYDTDAVDASLLQVPQTGFLAPDDPIMLRTVERIQRELLDEHGFVRRYLTDGTDGLHGEEGSFVMCSFWLVEQYARSGRVEEAKELMERLLAIRNDLGLLAEEYDAGTGELLGNFPQAFSHLSLIRAADAIHPQR